MDIREKIRKDLGSAVKALSLELDLAETEVTRSVNNQFGDYTTNIALKISHKFKQSPMELAKDLAGSLQDLPYVNKLEVKEPGFINFWIRDEIWQDQVKEVLDKKSDFGSNDLGKGKKARVEFVSANPTGPLHFGNARGGPIGDALASVLEFCGFKVLREYLDNDRGNQVTELGRTIASKLGLVEVDQENLSYTGDYTSDLASLVGEQMSDTGNLSEAEVTLMAGQLGVKASFSEIIHDCEEIGIKFDSIVHESDLQKQVPNVLKDFKDKRLLKKAEGAVWFAPKSEFLKDKDAVVVKSDGAYTYFTADLVYHKQKFESGYDLVVDVFGSSTSGHVPKLRALVDALGFDQNKFKVILYQFVRIKRGSDIVKMSKRAGNFVTLREVLNEVGRDALRFFILMHDANTHMDFDLALAKKKSSDNPVYYVQYAHARICSILAKAGPVSSFLSTSAKASADKPASNRSAALPLEAKRSGVGSPSTAATRFELLTTVYELALIKQITRFPELVEDIARSFAVHQLTRYSVDLAETFHKFYENCRVLEEKEDLKSARLALVSATQITLVNTLRLLGVSAPQKM